VGVVQKICFIHAEWDSEAGVWVATSNDVPGLATEARTIEELSKKLEYMVPELLEANGLIVEQEVPFELLARRFSVAHTSRYA
jgi:predicted RNase H-like HicB family nuclease